MLHTALRYAKGLQSYNPIPNGCVLYLPLWHPNLSGAKFKSIDPYGEEVTVNGATKVAKGFSFDGTDDNIILPANWMPSTGTIQIWMTPTAGVSNYLISSDLNEISIYKSDNGANLFNFYYNGAGTGNSATIDWTTGVWYHIVVTYGLNLNSIYYLDGSPITGGGACGAVTPTNVATRLGESTTGTGDYTGTIGECTIWNRVLSAEEIAYYYSQTKGRFL